MINQAMMRTSSSSAMLVRFGWRTHYLLGPINISLVSQPVYGVSQVGEEIGCNVGDSAELMGVLKEVGYVAGFYAESLKMAYFRDLWLTGTLGT